MLEPATLLVGTISTCLLALVVFVKNYRSTTNQLFVLLALALVGWSITTYFSLHTVSDTQALIWIRWIMFFVVFQNTVFFLLVKVFPSIHFNFWKNKRYLLVIIYSLVTAGVALSPLLFPDFRRGAPVPGPGMSLFLVHVLIFIYAGFSLVRRYLQATGLLRAQLAYLLAGTLFMFVVLPITNFIIPVVFKYNALVFLSPLYSIVFSGFIAYAIVKHRLLDIRLVVARTVSYTILVGIFGVFYALTFALLSSLFVSAAIETKAVTVSTALALVMAFTFQPLRHLLEKITDDLFYKDHYEANTLLYNLALLMASTLRLEEVTHGILDELLKQMKITKGAFILIEEKKVFDIKSKGYKSPPGFSEEEIKMLTETRDRLIFDEMEESDTKDILRKQELSLVFHLRAEGEQVGLLVLGGKQSGEIYSEQDINMLEILTPTAAVAIQNAKAYEEIRRFSITLQEEVAKATKDLQEANVKLQELDKLKDEFVSLASHELRTPMTAIKGSLSTILEGYAGEISPQAREFLTSAYNENDRLIRLVNNLLNISRIEAGRFTFNITRVDLDDLITEVVKSLQMAAKEKNLFLKYESLENLPQVFADRDKVKEVIINLVGNAIKFTHKGGITVKTEVKDGFVQTSVTDTGSGIAKEDQALLFKKFSQARSGYAKQTGGTGLGLYISKKIIEGQQGKIWLESILGQGSTFYFTLPVVS